MKSQTGFKLTSGFKVDMLMYLELSLWKIIPESVIN